MSFLMTTLFFLMQVMLEHDDFANDANPSRDNTAPTPTFTLVKKYNTRLVLVLDMSGSMEGEKLRQLRQVITHRLVFNSMYQCIVCFAACN